MELKIFPRMSEKSYAEAQNGIYIFDVPKNASKQQIIDAVSKQYSVSVVDANTTIIKGKAKRAYRKGGASVIGKKKDVKKAYVHLAEGQTISVFDENKESGADQTSAKEKK